MNHRKKISTVKLLRAINWYMYPNFKEVKVWKNMCILEVIKFSICGVFLLFVVFFFFKKFFSKHFILKNYESTNKLDESSNDLIYPWPRFTLPHVHYFLSAQTHTHTTLFLAEPLNIVAAVTSGVCWRTEVCYFSWFLSWRIPFPSFPYDHKEILYFFPQYFKFHQALKLLGVHFCVMSRDHIECFPWNNLAKQLHF